MTRLAIAMVLGLTACGDDGGSAVDAPSGSDTTSAAVTMVTCPATPAATVTTTNAVDAYAPAAVTISAGQVVKFTMSSNHDVAPIQGMSDPAVRVGFGQEKCLMFAEAGVHKFFCTPHGFAGMVTVN